MFQVVKDHPRAFLYAVLVHLALIGMLVFSLDWTIKPDGGPAQSQPVQAIAIDESMDYDRALSLVVGMGTRN